MENQTPHEKQNETVAEPRRLNMEEKRKLERLLIADIDAAASQQEVAIKGERDVLVEQLVRKLPAEVSKLFKRHQLAAKQQQEATQRLTELGYSLGYNSVLSVRSFTPLPKQVEEFDKQAAKRRQSFSDLRRSYIIRLFADHADTQSLFASLGKDLERLTR